MEYAIAIAAIIGLVNGFRLLTQVDAEGKRDLKGFAFFCLAIIAGIVFGALHWLGLPGIEAGFLAGLTSSGFYRVVQVI